MVDPCPEIIAPWWKWYPYVGFFIAILAGLGVLVPWFRGTEIGKREKALWTVVMVALVALELRSITLDGHQHEREESRARCQQLQSFDDIATKLAIAITSGEVQFRATMAGVSTVLNETKQAASAAKLAATQVTGGDSYAYVHPSVIYEGQNTIVLNVHNYGNEVLTGVSVSINHVIRGAAEPALDNGEIEMESIRPINMGSIAPREGRTIDPPGEFITLIPKPDGTDQYHFWVNAQNAGVSETIDFRHSLNGRGWAYKIDAWREVVGKHRRVDLFAKDIHGWIRFVKKGDWVEPSKHP